MRHWPEYAIEAFCLALFMVSAAAFATVLQHPASPWLLQTMPAFLARLPMGAAMGVTAIAIIYSPFGRRSGAHMNPVVTLTFLRLGKIRGIDACFYVLAQFIGGVAGIGVATWLLRGLPADPWGRPYTYRSPVQATDDYVLGTLGRDGREGGAGEDADIELQSHHLEPPR